jgi:sporulation protein YlmC with PRC-barrel domain
MTSRASELLGREIRDARGDVMGKIEELVVDDEDGRIAYAVVALETKAGDPGSDRVSLVPWDALRRSEPGTNGATERLERRAYLIDLDRERIAGAPGFVRGNWPRIDRAYGRTIYTYYGRRPYWERARLDGGTSASEELARDVAREREAIPRKPTVQDPNRTERDVPPLAPDDVKELEPFPVGLFEARNVKTVSGVVSSVIEQTGAENDFGVGVRLMLKRSDVKTPGESDLLVYVGPTAFVKKQGFTFNQNDRLTIKGPEMERDGRRILVAMEIDPGDGRTMLVRKENGLPLWKRRIKPAGE